MFLHEHKDFPGLLRIIEEEPGILAHLVEKDYWIIHCLYGLRRQGYNFQLKGGTSLSKGFALLIASRRTSTSIGSWLHGRNDRFCHFQLNLLS